MSVLEKCTNMIGEPISSESKKNIHRFLDNPTTDTWSEISGIQITKGKTIWQSVCALNPNFPRSGRRYHFKTRKIIKDWEQIPTPFEVMQAISWAMSERE